MPKPSDNDKGASDSDKAIRLLRPKRRISPLTFRILAVNLIALGFLTGGILFIDQYQETMTESRIEALVKDAEVMAGALGEAATVISEKSTLNKKPTEQIVARLVGVTGNRTRLFGLEGKLWLDSRDLAVTQSVIIDELSSGKGFGAFWRGVIDQITLLLDRLHRRGKLAPYQEVKDQLAEHYPEVMGALEGNVGYRVRRLSDRSEIITVAVPVQRFHRVLGALMLSTDTRDIKKAVEQTRMTFLKFFGVVLLLTILLSFFLARTIVRPILRLARSADRISAGTHTGSDIPDYSSRNDEVGDLSRSLKDMTLTLARQIDAVAAFAADVSHELKNPLTSLRSAIETLPYAKTDAAKAKLLGIIKDDVGRLNRLISDISHISRLDAEMSHGQMGRVNLRTMLETLIDLYQTSRGDEIPTLKLDISDLRRGRRIRAAFFVNGLEGQLGQLFRNLIDNAISFSRPGDMLSIKLRQSRDMTQIVIEDTGPGIPEDKLEDIFERFYSERPPGEEFGKHSGLGLSICQQIVEAHGGVIIAENRREGGARFTVKFPFQPAETGGKT